MSLHDMSPAEERLIELLADRATQGLTADEQIELDQLLAEHPEIDVDMLEEAAALVDLFHAGANPDPLPKHLLEPITHQAATHNAFAKDDTNTAPNPSASRSHRLWPTLAVTGWVAVACLAVIVWTNVPRTRTPTELAAKWLEDGDCRQIKGQTADPFRYPNANGEVLWKGSVQKGFLVLKGVPANDPQTSRYQLWIADSKRAGPPVSGGLFDVKTSGRVVIPFQAPLPIGEPTAFTITRERPEGVVVSEQTDVVFTATVP